MRRNRWSPADRQAFADGNRLRASSVPGRRATGPEAREWCDAHFNRLAEEGVTRCACGCKYWEHDRCIDCGLWAGDDLVIGDD
jgi:hypothetical protein